MIILATILILMCVIVSDTTNGSEMNCYPVIRVPRNTVFLAPVMSVLKINCTITLPGCHRNPRVSWCKTYGNDCKALNYTNHIRTEWKSITEHEWMAFFIFLNISMEDTGFYRCKEGDTTIGHAINVTVTDNGEDKVSHNQSNTIHDLNTPPNDGLQWLWYVLYICSGIVLLVFTIMIVSFLYIIRRQGRKSTRKDMANKNQYMETEKNDLLLPPNLCLNSDVLTSVVYRV
ncbi:uncharacterized protein LOC131542574 isoform X2 [Onychostoma macrolepis]|uniref:Ig-like domain-containing protein n=1 Tax=Onychostoma macrolepis TaxID=369639 RepID=A0A7J6DH85_9TELE|nr:uncharacterized protein LOC131542574 isoform X2 [Onychostoma macrolepis]KAF4118639.1 hypothetical protein G5714_000690 [Onychostoma macrolepis]